MLPILQTTKVLSATATKAILEVESLYPGYGITLGNALRRVLLSSLEGAAITSFRVAGVPHEFTSVEGVYEDVIEISLNLKRVRLRLFGDESQTLRLVAKGEQIVTAKSISANSNIEIVNPEAVIATLTDKKASLEMDLVVERGTGYALADRRKRKDKLPIGTIELDANFSPVVKVNFSVENMLVGESTDYNRLRLEIETDGTLDPLFAFDQAVEIVTAQLNALKVNSSKEEPEVVEESTFTVLNKSEDIKATVLEKTKLSSRTLNVLLKSKIKTLGDLEEKNWDKIKGLKGMGDKGVVELEKLAKQYGLNIK